MRVLTYNIHGWADPNNVPNLDRVTETLAASGAEIIGLNEVFYPRVVAGDTRPALEALAARLGMHYLFGPCVRWPAHNDRPAGGYGNALLARRPIVAGAAHHLGSVEGFHDRGLLEGRILLDDGSALTVYVTHLDHTNEETRAGQFRSARQWLIRDRRRPHLLMGDMNAISPWDFSHRPEEMAQLAQHRLGCNLVGGPGGGSEGIKLIPQIEKAGYVDLYRQAGMAAGARSYVPAELNLRIDFIFADRSLASCVTASGIVESADSVSDHRPVWVDLALERSGMTGAA